MASTTLYRSHKDVMTKTNHISKKVTHGGRKAGAQHAQASGANIEEIAQHGNWNNRRLVQHYLGTVTKDVPYKMAGFKLQNEEHWLERNALIPPVELQRQIFPFIEEFFPGNRDWARLIENIMLNNPEDMGRPESQRLTIPPELAPAWRLMRILAHMCKVKMFSSPAFYEFMAQLQVSIDAAKSPLTDSLAANTPAIQQEFRNMRTSVASMDSYLRENLGYVKNKIDTADIAADFQTTTVMRQVQSLDHRMMSVLSQFQSSLQTSLSSLSVGVDEESRLQAVSNADLQRRQQQYQELRQGLHRREEQLNAEEARRLLLNQQKSYSIQPERGGGGDLVGEERSEGPLQSSEESLPGETAASVVPALTSSTSVTPAPAKQVEEQNDLDHLAPAPNFNSSLA
ncbi:hypothetical protein EDD21DRAFT_60368 [Dissophora ornata]|nr:hypothetical protein EDD21DRAFT_60368 [Dissophora ornata]